MDAARLPQHAFAFALLAPCRAMTARGLRVDDTLRQERLAALTGEGERFGAEAQAIVAPLRERLAALPRQKLFFTAKVCKGCRNGKKKRLTCSACGGVGKATTFAFNPSSNTQIKEVLYRALRLPVRTKFKKESTDEEALQSLVAHDESGLVPLLLRYTKLDTMRALYERLAPAPDGVVRTVFNPAGTYTGRFASAEAFYVPHSTNLQNLPGGEEGKRDPLFNVRDTIVPEPGQVFLYADLSQAEARPVACLSEDEALWGRWQVAGWDIHVWTAAHLFQTREADVTPAQRYLGKRCRHALNYGMGTTRLWRTINADADVSGVAVTQAEAKRLWRAYHALHPNLDTVWWNRVEQALKTRGYLENCFGWRCNFHPKFDPQSGAIDAESLRAAIAWEPQSTVGRLTNCALLELYHEEAAGFQVRHQTHDAVLVSAPARQWRAVAERLKQRLERPIRVNGYTLTIPAEVFVCEERWSQMRRVL